MNKQTNERTIKRTKEQTNCETCDYYLSNFILILFVITFHYFHWTNERTNERASERRSERTNERANYETCDYYLTNFLLILFVITFHYFHRTNERTNEQTNEQTNERASEQAKEWTNKRTNKRTSEWTKGRKISFNIRKGWTNKNVLFFTTRHVRRIARKSIKGVILWINR